MKAHLHKTIAYLALSAAMLAAFLAFARTIPVAHAQPGPPRQAASQKAASPEMQRVWELFGGEWNTEEAMVQGEVFPNGGARRGVSSWRMAQDGRTLIGEGHSDGSAGPLNYMIVIWWNAPAKNYGFFVCFNGGESACQERGSARWQGDTFVNAYTEDFRGKKTYMTDTWLDITPQSHRLVFAMQAADGTMKTVITTRSVRKQAGEKF